MSPEAGRKTMEGTRQRGGRLRGLMGWVGPVAIFGGTFAMISDQIGLVVHLPEAGGGATGYHAVGSGLFLVVVTMLLVGLVGLYARRPDPRDARVVEYGDATARYVLVLDEEPEAPAAASLARGYDGLVLARSAFGDGAGEAVHGGRGAGRPSRASSAA